MRTDVDVAIVGSGFAGSLLAMALCRQGRTVALVERGRHPRFAIGESTSPLANLIVEELASRYDLPRVAPLATYGAWRRTYPDLVCGLKRGFTFFHHEAGRPYRTASDRANQLMVAASPSDEVADTHWLRADVDHFLVREAEACGAEYADEVALERFEPATGRLEGTRAGRPFAIRATLVVDASGPRGFLSRALNLGERAFEGMPRTQAIYSHFTDVARCDCMPAYASEGETPYPMDDAAVHHVFDGGWMWVLRFGNGVVSAGFSLADRLAQEVGLADGEAACRRLLARFPTVAEQFADARPIRELTVAPRLSYRARAAAGDNWVLLPSCAAFVDPLFSTGMPLALLGVERTARAVEEAWGTTALAVRLAEIARTSLDEADLVAAYTGASFEAMRDLRVFASLSMFYFAAASFTETARRLGSPLTPRHFLASDRERFARGLRAAIARVDTGRAFASPSRFARSVACAVRSTNVAGLCDPAKRNWYDASADLAANFRESVRSA